MLESTHTDEEGNVIAVYNDGDLGVYKHTEAKTKADIDLKRKNSGKKSGGGEKTGETPYWNEFRQGDRIMFGETWNNALVDLAVDASEKGRGAIAIQSTTGGKYDIKNNTTLAPYGSGTGKKLGGKYISAESAGNFLAGFNGAVKESMTFEQYMQLAGALHQAGKSGVVMNDQIGKIYGDYPWFGENDYAGRMILWGWLTSRPSDEYANAVWWWYKGKEVKK
jgi:hypothetical protein